MIGNERVTRREAIGIFGASVGITSTSLLSRSAVAANSVTIKMNNGDSTLRNDKEACTISDDVMRSVGFTAGEQIRVAGPSDAKYESGLYTVVGDSRRRSTVEMGKGGMDRMGFDNKTTGEVRAYAPHPEYETREQASEHDEYVEILRDDGEQSAIVACAPHGGWIEYRTDRQAERAAAALDGTEWSGVGYNSGGGAFDRWHITSTAIHPRSFPKLDTIADRGFDHAVSFHGFTQDGIAIGGGASESFRLNVRDTIDTKTDGAYDVYLADENGDYAGTSSENFVNWLTTDGNGVQIEQSWDARVNDWPSITDAVVEVYTNTL